MPGGGKTRTSGQGRPKGTPNKTTALIKDMIIKALNMAGGDQYLARQANENPAAFMVLVGKVLPLQITGDSGAAIEVRLVRYDEAQAADDG